MSIWPHDDTAALIAFYGDPRGLGWGDRNLVQVIPPWKMTYENIHAIPHFSFHKKCAGALERVFKAVWDHYGHNQAAIAAEHLDDFGGSYNFRPIRGSTRLSCHAFGAAIDMAPEENPMNMRHVSAMPPAVIAAFKAEGAYWGGDFHSRQDPMHFQFAHE